MLSSRCAKASEDQHFELRGPPAVYSSSLCAGRVCLVVTSAPWDLLSQQNDDRKNQPSATFGKRGRKKMIRFREGGHFAHQAAQCLLSDYTWRNFTTAIIKWNSPINVKRDRTNREKTTKRRPRTLIGEFHFMIASFFVISSECKIW